MEQVPLRTLTGMVSELVEITRNYDKIHHRNKKKDDAHLNKHAMHLVRLYLMCLDILEKEEIVAYRPAGEEHFAPVQQLLSDGSEDKIVFRFAAQQLDGVGVAAD